MSRETASLTVTPNVFPETPEPRSVYSEMARFMNRHLKKNGSPTAGADEAAFD